MIERLLPDVVACVESSVDAAATTLFPAEQEVIATAVPKRRAEFTTGRWCAREALARLGVAPAPILPGPRGGPQWPAGYVGSITHCDGYRAAAVARRTEVASVGIDAEPHAPLPDGVLDLVSLDQERAGVAGLAHAAPGIYWDRLLFCIKESVYKVWFPLTGRWLDFAEAAVRIEGGRIDAEGSFSARLLVPGPVVHGTELDIVTGRWRVVNGLILTAIALTAPVRNPTRRDHTGGLA